MIILML